jgi:hypothetical protein
MDLTNSSLLIQIAQPPLNVLTQTVITSIVAILSVWFTGWNYLRIENFKNESMDHQRRQQAYSVFIGRKYSLTQSTHSFITSSIHIIYYNYIHNLNSIYYRSKGCSSQEVSQTLADASIFRLAKDEIQANKELLQKVAQEREQLWETIGLIQVLFPKTDELTGLIKQFDKKEKDIENFHRSINGEGNSIQMDMDEGKPELPSLLEQWYDAKNASITDWENRSRAETENVIKDLESALDNVITYLDSKINKKEVQESRAIQLWQFWRRG